MTSLFKKLSIFIKIGVIKRYGVCLVSFKIVNRIRKQSSRIVFTPPTPTRQNSFVASAVSSAYTPSTRRDSTVSSRRRRRCVLGLIWAVYVSRTCSPVFTGFMSLSASSSLYSPTKLWTAVHLRICRPTSPASPTFHLDRDYDHLIYATADEADAYMFYRCFFSVFSVFFLFFSVRQKIPDNRFRERLKGFSWNFYQTIAGKM